MTFYDETPAETSEPRQIGEILKDGLPQVDEGERLARRVVVHDKDLAHEVGGIIAHQGELIDEIDRLPDDENLREALKRTSKERYIAEGLHFIATHPEAEQGIK